KPEVLSRSQVGSRCSTRQALRTRQIPAISVYRGGQRFKVWRVRCRMGGIDLRWICRWVRSGRRATAPRRHACVLRRSHNPGSHSRLIKEARALAQLDHPNVVKVHDVFSDGEQIVVVMELVAGQTLEQWEAERPRTWREVIDVYAQAGE